MARKGNVITKALNAPHNPGGKMVRPASMVPNVGNMGDHCPTKLKKGRI